MSFPTITATTEADAAAALVSACSAAGLQVGTLTVPAATQLAVANLLQGDPTTANIPAGDVLSGTFGANKAGGADTGSYAFPAGTSQGGAPGATSTETTIIHRYTGIADNTATPTCTLTIPNAAHSAMLRVTVVGACGAGGGVGADEATTGVSYNIALTRTSGANAVGTASTGYGSAAAKVAGGDTLTCTAALSSVGGAVGAVNTFTVDVTIHDSTGSGASHSCLVFAELLNANASGVTIAA